MAKRKHSDRYTLEFPLGVFPKIKAMADAAGKRLNGFVVSAVCKQLGIEVSEEDLYPPRGRPKEVPAETVTPKAKKGKK